MPFSLAIFRVGNRKWWRQTGSRQSTPYRRYGPDTEIQYLRKSQKTRQSTVQEVNRGQSWLSPPLLMAPKHCKTSIFGAMTVPEREFLEPRSFPGRRAAGLLSFAQYRPRLAKPSRILSKREADTEFQYRPHIVDTDMIADAIFADAISKTSTSGLGSLVGRT